MTPRVSVVIPSYNNADYVEATVRSVIEQTYDDFELLISDHSSSDGTWDLLQQFTSDPRVHLSQVPQGGGAPANWRAVTALASGELLKLVCADDLLAPTALQEQVAAMDAHPSAVLVSSLRDIVDADDRIVVRGRGLQGMDGLVPGDVARRRTVVAGSNVFGEPACSLVRTDALRLAGSWDDRSPYLLDQATFSAVLRFGDLVALRRTLATFRISHGQWSVALAKEQAAHARGFHRSIGAEQPGLLSRRDRWVGDVRATGMAVARRAVYQALRLRRRPGGVRIAPDAHPQAAPLTRTCPDTPDGAQSNRSTEPTGG